VMGFVAGLILVVFMKDLPHEKSVVGHGDLTRERGGRRGLGDLMDSKTSLLSLSVGTLRISADTCAVEHEFLERRIPSPRASHPSTLVLFGLLLERAAAADQRR
jgi:hypothetical protein